MSEKAPLRLVVLGDSTAFSDHRGPQLPTEPSLYPNVVRALMAEALEREVDLAVIARAGTDSRDAWRTVTKDRHAMFEVLMGADAVIIGVGSLDNAPAGVPHLAEVIAGYLRPAWLRRRARALIRTVHPIGVRVTGGRRTRVPRAESERFMDGVLLQARSLARGAAFVVLGPTSHASSYYGDSHPTYHDRLALQGSIAERHGLAFVPSWPLVEPHRASLNPDGIHWPPQAHAAVGAALAAPLIAQLTGEAPIPSSPG